MGCLVIHVQCASLKALLTRLDRDLSICCECVKEVQKGNRFGARTSTPAGTAKSRATRKRIRAASSPIAPFSTSPALHKSTLRVCRAPGKRFSRPLGGIISAAPSTRIGSVSWCKIVHSWVKSPSTVLYGERHCNQQVVPATNGSRHKRC